MKRAARRDPTEAAKRAIHWARVVERGGAAKTRGLGSEYELALPHELTPPQQVALVQSFAQDLRALHSPHTVFSRMHSRGESPMPSDSQPTCVNRLYILLCGFEILPKTISTRGRGSRFILSEPVCAYLLDTSTGWVLLDAGMNPANGRDPARKQDKFLSHNLNPPVIRDDHLIENQLARVGIGWADIQHVILSHLHYDHCGCLDRLTHARISVQRREHAHAFGPNTGKAYFRDEYADMRLQWDLQDGDWEAMPGLRWIDTCGHTPGHQSAFVDLPRSGTLSLPFDAGDLQENFDSEVIPGECCDDAAALRALRRIKAFEAQTRATRLLFHDPQAIQSLRLCPEVYD